MTGRTAPTTMTSNALSLNVLTTTGSFSPSSKGVQFVWLWAQSGAAFTDTTTVVGNGRTWAKVESIISGNFYAGLFVGYGAAPTTGTIAITFSRAPTSGRYGVYQQDRLADVTINPVKSSAQGSGTGTSGSVTLTEAVNRCLSFWGHNATEVTAPDASATWTELDDSGGSAPMNIENQYMDGADFSPSASWVSNVFWAGVAVVLKKGTYTANADINADPEFAHSGLGEFFPEGDEEGAVVAGKPSGSWSIVGGS